MRLLVLHQHYWPENAATAQILSDLCEDLAAAGHDVTVVCGQPSYHQDGQRNLPASELHNGVRIRRVWSVRPKQRNIPSRLLQYGSYFGTSLTSALLSSAPDVCLVMSTPPLLLGVSAGLLRVLRQVPFVYSVQDLYPDIAVHLGVLPGDAFITRAISAVADVCYRNATALVALSEGMANALTRKGVPRSKLRVIPNWADTSSVRPAPRDNDFARAHGLCDDFVVQYSGNLGLSQGLEVLLGAAELLREKRIKFLLVGSGNARESLESNVRARSLVNVKFLPPQPREQLGLLLSSCDVGAVPMKRGVSNDLVPSKLYGIMAAGRPVLASVESDSEVARVVREHDCGWLAEPESAEDFAAAVLRSHEASSQERDRRGANGARACAAFFSRGVLTAKYRTVIEEAARA